MQTKLFTKSAFKKALECQTASFYLRMSDTYANQQLDDDFLESLAEGGFQVGEIAKVYYGIPEENCIDELDYDTSLRKTQEFFRLDKVNIAEAAFKWRNCFVRNDILVKNGFEIQLIEVKAKSWNPLNDSFTAKDGLTIIGPMIPYIYDIAFQKYVVCNALKELYPDMHFTVKAFLMMADKSTVADVDGINQKFVIKEDASGRKRAVREAGADDLALHTHIVNAFDVDDLCNKVIDGKTAEQASVLANKFQTFVEQSAEAYVTKQRIWSPLGKKCFACPFKTSDKTPQGLQDGFKECWKHWAKFTDDDFQRPLISDLWGAHINRGKLLEGGRFFLSDIKNGDFKDAVKKEPGLTHSERKWLQIGMWTDNKEILKQFASHIDGDAYLDKPELRKCMDSWTYPLHMIDFETTAVALPFYKGMSPYEKVAFQFSHHIIRKSDNGTYQIEHAGQYINTEKGYFPNFDFVRELKSQLEKDNGTIFRYSAHENTTLREIYSQLSTSNEADKQELMDWIDSITSWKEGNKEVCGPRNMEDLFKIVKSFYYHKSMKGSNSIKAVLPAVLNSSRFIQDKYSRPIYGLDIRSCTFTPDEAIAWITFAEDGRTVENPYKHLPPVGSYLNIDDSQLNYDSDDEEMTIANGGAALTAYSKLQFSDIVASEALKKALLRYCELDTMAMVFIWEFFYHEVYQR